MLYTKYSLTHQEQIHEDHGACGLEKETHRPVLYLANLLHFHDQNMIHYDRALFLVNNLIKMEILNKINY
jgi:hypothetical protein